MIRTNAREITVSDWVSHAASQARTLSVKYRPNSVALACTYECDAASFLSGATYLVRFTDPSGNRIVPYNDPVATPITIQRFAQNSQFADSVLKGWYQESIGEINEAEVITMHCSGCDRRIVVDGVHRITWIASNNISTAKIRVTELSGLSWPQDMPDMGVVCSCGSAA